MRIAFLLTEFPVISELFIVRQITGLLERGHEVTIFAEPSANPARHERIEAFGLLERTVFRSAAPASMPARLSGLLRVARAEPTRGALSVLRTANPLRRGQEALNARLAYAVHGWAGAGDFDLVHAHFGPNGVVAVDLRAVGCFDAPVLTTFHGHDINVLPGGPGARGYDRLFNEGDAFTFNSQFLVDKAATLGCPPERSEILRMGVELPPSDEMRRPATGPMRVLTVARLVPEKAVRDAIAAVQRAVAGGAELRYRIVGGGPLEVELKAQIASAGLEEIVSMTGAASEVEVRQAYRESDLFVLPSIRAADGSEEAQGLVLQEAQAMGLPVLTTSIGGIPEGVDDGGSGYLVPPGDVDALAARLTECANDPELRERLGRRGRELVEERFDIERLNDRLVAVYEDTIRGRSGATTQI